MSAFQRAASRRLVAAVVLFAAVLAGCLAIFPSVPAEDATDAAFVRQVVPILYGRKVRGYDEVKLLSDLIAAVGREKMLRALTEMPEFVDHWTEVLIDDLRIARNAEPLAQGVCFGEPKHTKPDPAIANAIANGDPQTSAPGGPFNMVDVVRSALVADNLYPVYRARLYSIIDVMFAPEDDEIHKRERIGARFAETFLNRQMGCLICHNSQFSMSGAASGWNRTHPILGLFEKALFGASNGGPLNNTFAMFRSDSLAKDPAMSPWGLESCGNYNTALPDDPQNFTPYFGGPHTKNFGVHDLQAMLQSGYTGLKTYGLQRTSPPGTKQTCDYCAANCKGVTIDIAQAANNAPNAAAVKALFVDKCKSCHGGAANLIITDDNDWANDLILQDSIEVNKKLVQPGSAGTSYLINKITGSGLAPMTFQMPLGDPPLDPAQIAQVTAWVNGMAPQAVCAQCASTNCLDVPQDVAAEEAFAYLVAARVVNNVWEESMGYPLTIANYFPRNADQQQILWNLTEYKFLPNWSVKDLLVRILTSELFNRQPPSTSGAATPYVLPPVHDPWIEADPRVPPVSEPGYDAAQNPENHRNAMSEGVRRYSARSLTYSVHKALDWPRPKRSPDDISYPERNMMRSIGYYLSDEEPGFQTVDFQGLLAWETAHGTCTKPTGVAIDWIDKLASQIAAFNPQSPGGPLTARDVAVVLRDWLLGYGALTTTVPQGLSQSEVEAMRIVFGVASIDDPASGVADLAAKLRTACGIYVETPQFKLAGIVPTGLGPKPRVRVCNTTDCTYQEMCVALQPSVVKFLPEGATLTCGNDSVNVNLKPVNPPEWAELCPGGWCIRIPYFIKKVCDPLSGGSPIGNISPLGKASVFENIMAVGGTGAVGAPQMCTLQAPLCDPRCTRLDCCGGTLTGDLGVGDGLIAWADGAYVLAATDVLIRPHSRSEYEPLRRGRTLETGDLLALKPGSTVELRTRDGKVLRTPARGYGKNDQRPAVFMMISGEQAIAQSRPASPDPALAAAQRERALRILKTPWAAAGEGGAPLTNERRQRYRYSEDELRVEYLRKRGLLTPELEAALRK